MVKNLGDAYRTDGSKDLPYALLSVHDPAIAQDVLPDCAADLAKEITNDEVTSLQKARERIIAEAEMSVQFDIGFNELPRNL